VAHTAAPLDISTPERFSIMAMTYLLQRSTASSCLDITKIKALTPCDVENVPNAFKARITRIVFDPARIHEVNSAFKAAGYNIPDGTDVIAENEDGSILLWGGLNSVYYLRKGENIEGALDNIAFDDLLDMTRQFKIKNKKTEIDEMVALLKQAYGEHK
jgi:hypothetical protein